MLLDNDIVADGQAKAGAFSRGFRRKEGIEHLLGHAVSVLRQAHPQGRYERRQRYRDNRESSPKGVIGSNLGPNPLLFSQARHLSL